MDGTRPPRPPGSPRDQRDAYALHPTRPSVDVNEELELNSSLARLCSDKKLPTFASHRDSINVYSTHRYPKSTSRRQNKKNTSTPIPRTRIASRTCGLYDSIGTTDSRDPVEFAPVDDGSFGRFVNERRDNRMGKTRVTHKGLRKKYKQQTQQRHSHNSETTKGPRRGIQRSVSFADGDNGNAVTSVNHYQIYSDEEKAACFYSEKDFRKFRAEHYLGITCAPDNPDEQSPEYTKAANVMNDFLAVMSDMWNSFLDLAYSSSHE